MFETYNKVDGSVVFNIHQQIKSLKQNGTNLFDYYNKLDSIWKDFDGQTNLSECTCEVATMFNNHAMLMNLIKFLSGLDDSYN